jgi:hypothetical protein
VPGYQWHFTAVLPARRIDWFQASEETYLDTKHNPKRFYMVHFKAGTLVEKGLGKSLNTQFGRL